MVKFLRICAQISAEVGAAHESASGQIKQMVKQLPSPRLKSKTVQRDGIEMTLELWLKDNETGFVEKFMRVEGVYDAALISHQGDIVS